MINQEILKEYLSYDKETGIFIWIKKTSSHANYIKIGDIAGGDGRYTNGYILIKT